MERNCQELWSDCLALIRERLIGNDSKNGQHVFDVWFAPIVCEDYDEQANAVLLQVPCVYVYEYLEQCQVGLLSWALPQVFRPGVQLRYRIAASAPQKPVADVFASAPQRSHLAVANARERLENGLRHYLGDGFQWLPAYERIVRWLTDNRGRGLLCMGTSGLGKSLVCERILPVLIGDPSKIVTVTAQQMSQRIDELLRARCVVIDDLGKEDTKRFGQTDRSFYNLCDAAEHDGKLLIITTNLTTTPVQPEYRHLYPCSIEERYGPEVLSRLRSLVLPVLFEGQDMRK